MNHQTLFAAAILCVAALAPTAFAGHHEGGHAGGSAAAGETGSAQASADKFNADKVNAEIRRIDLENGKVTLKHEALAQFDMAAMTMVFRVEDPALLKSFSVGDRVRFVPAKKNGQFVVVSMEKAQ